MWKVLKGLPKGGWRQTLCPLTLSTKPEKTLSCHSDDGCGSHKDIDGNFEKVVTVAGPHSSSLSRRKSDAEIADRRGSNLTWRKRISSHKNFGTGYEFSNNFFEFLGFGFVIVAGLKYCRNGYFCNDEKKKSSVVSEGGLNWDALFRNWMTQRSGLQRTVLPIGTTILSESVSSDSNSYGNDDHEEILEEGEAQSLTTTCPLLQEHLIRLKDITNQYIAYKLNEGALELVQEENFEEAVEHFREASELGYDKAIFNLGVCYEIGQGIDRDLTKAWSCYEKAAKLGHTNASYNLAVFFLEGKGVTVNENEGLKWMEKASDSGMKEAQTYMGVRYGQNQDYDKAVNLFKKAAEQKHSEAEYWLGLCYENGLGVEENLTEAADLFLKSNEAGNIDACYNLAMYYEQGLGGLAKDKNHALKLYYQAATSGHPLAIKKLEFGLADVEDEVLPVVSSPKSKPPSKQDGIRAVSSLPDMKSVMQNAEKKVVTNSSLLDLTRFKKLLINYFEFETTNKPKKYYLDEEEERSNPLLDNNTFENSKTLLG